jgi:hypothetical protein
MVVHLDKRKKVLQRHNTDNPGTSVYEIWLDGYEVYRQRLGFMSLHIIMNRQSVKDIDLSVLNRL